MGTWDIGSFGNDTAVDWTSGLQMATDLSYVESALDRCLQFGAGQEVPADVAECAVAASEVVAGLGGAAGSQSAYSEIVDDWVKDHAIQPPRALVAKAAAALDRIVSPPSELLELWSEAGDDDSWINEVRALKTRLAVDSSAV
jgi:hypothetical protein